MTNVDQTSLSAKSSSRTVPRFSRPAGDKSPVLYREQGLWDAPPVELELTSVIIIPRPADRGDAIYRTREWGDVGPKSKGQFQTR